MVCDWFVFFCFFSSRRRHTILSCDWSSDVCSSDLAVFRSVSFALLGWAVVFALLARDAPGRPPAKGIRDIVTLLSTRPLAWALAAFYFLTFGGFAAFSIYLPTLLKDSFGLTPTDA